MVKKGLSSKATFTATWHNVVSILRPNWLLWERKLDGAGAGRRSGRRREGGRSANEGSQWITELLQAEVTGHGNVGMTKS